MRTAKQTYYYCNCRWVFIPLLEFLFSYAAGLSIAPNHNAAGGATTKTVGEKPHLLIIGMGGVGRIVAEQARNHFDIIHGTTRKINSVRPEDAPNTKKRIVAIPFDASAVEECLKSCPCRHILVTTPPLFSSPDSDDSPLTEKLPFANIIPEYLKSSLQQSPAWIGVLSTTGVYGDHKGEWVTETSPCYCPEGSSAAAYLQWERAWKEFGRQHSYRIRIFRCAGIYGATRSSLHTLYKKGVERDDPSTVLIEQSESSIKAGSSISPSLTNRIHESDLAAAVLASMLQDGSSSTVAATTTTTSDCFEVYNLADNMPESRAVVFAYAHELFASRNIDIPLRDTTLTNQTKRSIRRSRENKQVCNRKMRQQLLPDLKFPTYKEGLEDILQQPDAPWFSSRTNAT